MGAQTTDLLNVGVAPRSERGIAGLLSNLFRGDARALLTHLLREDEIGAADLEQMRALVNGKEKKHA